MKKGMGSWAEAMAFGMGVASISAAALRAEPFGPLKCGIIAVLAIVAIWGGKRFSTVKSLSSRDAALVLFAALCSVIDIGLILGASGWGDGTYPYFRPPLNHDGIRNVNIISAIIRGEGSPYLPQGKWAYQLFWYHAVAPWVSLASGNPSFYPAVAAVTWVTGLLFYGFLYWAVLSFIRRRGASLLIFLAIVFLCAFHLDLYYGLKGLWQQGRFLFEEEWPEGTFLYFRYLSPKSLVLISPQHAFFGVFGILFWVADQNGTPEKTKAVWSLLAFLVSPVLWGMFFPFFFLVTRRSFLALAVSGACGFFLFWILCGFSPVALLLRPEGISPWFPSLGVYWALAPLSWAGASGALGVIALILFIRSRGKKCTLGWILLLSALFLHLVYTQSETRRYFAVLGGIFLPLFLAEKLTLPRRTVFWLCVLAVMGISFHSSFWRQYWLKPSVVPRDVGVKDYLAMNQWLREQGFRKAILAAYEPRIGLEKPIVMEAVTSWAHPVETAIHTQLDKEQFAILKKIYEQGTPFPQVWDLGYRYFLEGPIERVVWSRVLGRLIEESKLIHTVGDVKLWEWRGLTSLSPSKLESAASLR